MPDSNHQIAQSLTEWWAQAGVETEPLVLVKPPSKEETTSKTASHPASIPVARQNVGKPNPNRQQEARALAASCQTLQELTKAIQGFDAGRLSDGATQAVIARGNPKAKIMLIGEAPGRDEDKEGKPFIGRSGQFLDKMFASIGLGEDELYITNGVFWRPKGNRTPTPEETAMCLPFVERHIALIQPQILVSVGGSSTKTLLGTETGITRLRGRWSEYTLKNPDGSDSETLLPLLPFYHPAFVLRKPATKRDCWQDLLGLRERLQEP